MLHLKTRNSTIFVQRASQYIAKVGGDWQKTPLTSMHESFTAAEDKRLHQFAYIGREATQPVLCRLNCDPCAASGPWSG